jgi:toxin-antitoxin system PIN domain toxin
MKKTLLLPDVNVWVALSFSSHIHHFSANTWFKSLSTESLCFCRMTQQGFLRLATNPRVFAHAAVPFNRAWQLYDAILTDPRISFTGEPANIEPHWRSFTQGVTFAPNLWNDAYLAAFSVAGNYELVTFDKGFGRYPGLTHKVLT